MKQKFVYFFSKKKSEGSKEMKELLGGKGAGLAEMTNIGLPVPAGFTITTEVCDLYYKNGRKLPRRPRRGSRRSTCAELEKAAGKKLGDPKDPLLVSVRSGAARLHARHDGDHPQPRPQRRVRRGPGQARPATAASPYDAYRRFIQMYGSTAMGLVARSSTGIRRCSSTTTRKQLSRRRQGTTPTSPPTSSRSSASEFKAFYKKNIKARTSPRTRWSSSGAPSTPSSAPGRPTRPSPTAASRRSPTSRARPSTSSADGLRQQGRQLRHRRLLHPRPEHRRERLLRRLPDQRPGRGRRGRHPHPDQAHPSSRQADAQGLQAALRRPQARSRSTTRRCRTSSSPSRTRSSTCSSAAPASARPRPPSRSPSTW